MSMNKMTDCGSVMVENVPFTFESRRVLVMGVRARNALELRRPSLLHLQRACGQLGLSNLKHCTYPADDGFDCSPLRWKSL